jgi:hypothetical protein
MASGLQAHNGARAHQVILVQAQLFFAIAKEHLDVPKRCDMPEQYLWRSLQGTRSPVARLRERSIQRLPYDHHLARVELAHAGGNDMYIDVLIALGPLQLDVVTGRELGRIVAATSILAVRSDRRPAASACS